MSMQNISLFGAKRKNKWIFSLILVFFVLVAIKTGDVYYNNFANWLSDKSSGWVSLPLVEEQPFRLGLDLQGGAQLTYQADISDIGEADVDDLLEGVRDLIERRVNTFGVSEPVVQVNRTADDDYRIIVELAGVANIEDAVKEIGETPRLEFKEQDLDNISLNEEALSLMDDYNQGLEDQISGIIEEINSGADFSELAKENNTPLQDSADAPTLENDGSLGWITEEDDFFIISTISDLEPGQISDVIRTENELTVFKLNDKRQKEESEILEYNVSYISLLKMTEDYLSEFSENWKNTELSGRHLEGAVLQFNPNTNTPEVLLQFNSEGSQLFADITARNVGKPVAIYLDDYPISVPNVNEKITDGNAVISGSFSIEEAQELVQRLKAGALPVPIELINQKSVGASLGQQSVLESLEAGILGLILVALFMIIVYRFFGLAAVLSLIVYGLSVLAVFKTLPVFSSLFFGLLFVLLILIVFEELRILNMSLTLIFATIGVVLFVYGLNAVTLTLAGVAGFILSIGMAVDANVLIFERIKEEMKMGRSPHNAIDEGIRKAWPSIRDGNFSTLMLCLVLMMFGTSVLKGFGTTLFIGVSVSMFSAIVITRSFLLIMLHKKMEKYSFLFGVRLPNKVSKN